MTKKTLGNSRLKCAIYTRVSCGPQSEGDGLEYQDRKLRTEAEALALEFYTAYFDAASATTIKNRPVFLDMLTGGEDLKIDGIIVNDTS